MQAESRNRDSDGSRASFASRGLPLRFTCDGEELSAFEGETVAGALLAAGRRTCRHTDRRGEPRGLFCGMGICFDCVVHIEGQGSVRGCQTLVSQGMEVRTQRDVASWEMPS
jgi:predicted molibdopterin-dependent oxidoreductase YjgC